MGTIRPDVTPTSEMPNVNLIYDRQFTINPELQEPAPEDEGFYAIASWIIESGATNELIGIRLGKVGTNQYQKKDYVVSDRYPQDIIEVPPSVLKKLMDTEHNFPDAFKFPNGMLILAVFPKQFIQGKSINTQSNTYLLALAFPDAQNSKGRLYLVAGWINPTIPAEDKLKLF